MFNSPALDIAIGLVFIFLLYSLLATSIQEAISTGLSLRAKMLRRSIIENMLSDTPEISKWEAVLFKAKAWFRQLKVLVGLAPKNECDALGDRFYKHPLIKNYGESHFFPLPSYIPRDNFSAVLVDILLKDFSENVAAIAAEKIKNGVTHSQAETEELLRSLPDAKKIREILTYHITCYDANGSHACYLPKETCRILEMHLRNSYDQLHTFCSRLESWFDDSMRRVSGWYKRKTQFILFLIGLGIAFFFNVDTIEISSRLSTDKDARDKLVNMAMKASEQYKDDPRVQQLTDSAKARGLSDTENAELEDLRHRYDRHMDEARKTIDGDIATANNILSVGWNGFGQFDQSYINHIKVDSSWWRVDFASAWRRSHEKNDSLQMQAQKISLDLDIALDSINRLKPTEALAGASDRAARALQTKKIARLELQKKVLRERAHLKCDSIENAAYFAVLKKDHPVAMRVRYMAWSMNARKLLGFLVLAFGICLGAPFWFDLLNKLVTLRGAGKKETGDNTAKITPSAPPSVAPPIQVTVNNQQSGEEAVG